MHQRQVIEPIVCEDIFVTGIANIENVGGVLRFSLCVPEEQPGGNCCCVIRVKLLIPIDQVIPMSKEAISHVANGCYSRLWVS